MSRNKITNLKTDQISVSGTDGFNYPLKVLLYSHDSVGLGHLRRNLAIAGEIASTFPNSNILIITGSPCATQFQLPPRTDLIKIPTITKNREGRYVSQNFSGSLKHTLEFRSRILLEAFEMFEPTVIIIDHQLTGLKGEALATLKAAKQKGAITIYGSRDIKDSPEVMLKKWNTAEVDWALQEGYDRMFVYGVPEVFDPRVAYAPRLDKIRKIDFTGYIVPRVKRTVQKSGRNQAKKVLVTFGGGGDGVVRAESYLRALSARPAYWDSHIVTGPLMDVERKRRLRTEAKRIQHGGSIKIQGFNRNMPALLSKADAVVSMAGYNSCAEILQSGIPAVLLPRSFPRKEQLIRATRMAELGWVSVIPEANPDPAKLFQAVEQALASPRKSRPVTDINGLANMCKLIVEQLHSSGLIKNVPHSIQLRKSAV